MAIFKSIVGMRTMPDEDMQRVVTMLLSVGVLRPVDMGKMSFQDIHNIWRNADEHLLLAGATDPNKLDHEGKIAVRELRELAAKLRRDCERVLFWKSVPLANRLTERYRKAIAINYEAMVRAGCVLVGLGEPQLAELYRSLCTR